MENLLMRFTHSFWVVALVSVCACGGGGTSSPPPEPAGPTIELQQSSSPPFAPVLIGTVPSIPSTKAAVVLDPIDPQAPLPGTVRIWDDTGFDVRVPLLTRDPLTFICPPLIDVDTRALRAGTLSLSVTVDDEEFPVNGTLAVEVLPPLLDPPGTFTVRLFEAIAPGQRDFGADIRAMLSTLDGAGVTDHEAAGQAADLLDRGTLALAQMVRSLFDGDSLAGSLGAWSDASRSVPLVLEAADLALLDELCRMIPRTLLPDGVAVDDVEFLAGLPDNIAAACFTDQNALLRVGAASLNALVVVEWLLAQGAPLSEKVGERPGSQQAVAVALVGAAVAMVILWPYVGKPMWERIIRSIHGPPEPEPTQEQVERQTSVLRGTLWTEYFARAGAFWSSVSPPADCTPTSAKLGPASTLPMVVSTSCDVQGLGSSGGAVVDGMQPVADAVAGGQIQPYPWAVTAGTYSANESRRQYGTSCYDWSIVSETASVSFTAGGAVRVVYEQKLSASLVPTCPDPDFVLPDDATNSIGLEGDGQLTWFGASWVTHASGVFVALYPEAPGLPAQVQLSWGAPTFFGATMYK